MTEVERTSQVVGYSPQCRGIVGIPPFFLLLLGGYADRWKEVTREKKSITPRKRYRRKMRFEAYSMCKELQVACRSCGF